MEINFPQSEKKILEFWKKNRIFEKSITMRKKAPDFVFYEGPPTANGKPGIHHVLSRAFKDIVCRYKAMQGFKVLRKAGWDTHGLPVELEIEKKMGFKNKKDIEKFGIAKFNELCKESVWQYKKNWEDLTERIAFWLDLKNPYITYESDYIETVWWILKQIHQKGLLYNDYKVLPYCPRCGTGLSSHEVAQGYKKVKEPAIYVKFRLKKQNKHLLVWTTTPWTLPGNVAVAVNPALTYVEAVLDKETLILAKERLGILGKDCKIIKTLKGKELMGLEYEPLYSFIKPEKKAWLVVAGDFVSLKEGTGLVHIAPAFGEDDMMVGKKNDLPVFLTVDEEGKFKKEIKDWAGFWVKDADPKITQDLRERNILFKEEQYLHDYPFCWRCKSPLLYYAKQSWFINMQKVKKELIKNNRKINWTPSHLKEGRFGEWLREIKDWAISRERYWGTPLPIWQCKKCKNLEVIGSKKDLASQRFSNNKYFVLRHGESLRNQKKLVVCFPEKIHCPLTEKGKRQIKAAVQKLKTHCSHTGEKIDLIFSSDLLRTKQTAEIVAKELNIKLEFDERLRELDMGSLNGKPVEKAGKFWDKERKLKLMDYYLKRFKIRAPGGENYLDCQKRMYQFLKDVDKKYQSKTILIISHELPITVLEGAVKGLSPVELIKFRKKLRIKTGECRRLDLKVWPYNKEGELDFHRPYIDEVKFYCKKCEGLMEKVPEVIDCWFDSGSMPFAQHHYPFDKDFQFPADYISEAIDQTRGWFYTLLAISTLLGSGPSYKNVISLGHVLDEKGEKMSKSKGNIVDPWYIIEKYGIDSVRWYFYTINQPGEPKLFSEKEIDGALKKFILTLWNSFMFFKTYARMKLKIQGPKSKNILDRWIASRLNNIVEEVTQKLNSYDVTGAARAIESFTIEDLSLWYIRRSRRRFQKPKNKKELKEAEETLGFLLLTLSELTAPFIPFLSEEIYRGIENSKTNSVHLEGWPKANKKSINGKLEKQMQEIRGIIASALAERAKAGIKVRQPLPGLRIKNSGLRKEKELLGLIKEEVNVKEIAFGKTLKLDTRITPELKEEGIIRDIIRHIQEMRKKADLKPQDKIKVFYSALSEIGQILARNKAAILKEARLLDLISISGEKKNFNIEKEVMVDDKKLLLLIKKV